MIGGAGSVQSLTTSGFTDTPLRPGDVVGFTPGTIHRLVNAGDLRLAILAQNSGLPEAGDAVLTFPAPVPADLDVYRRTAVLTGDLALEGFLALRRDGGLRKFHAAAHRLKGALLDAWDVRQRAGGRAPKTGRRPCGGRL
ncbi:cupin, partial [Streptomyces sp. NPDC057193]